MDRVSTNPQSHAAVYLDVHKAVVARFPYLLIYREEGGELVVISVFHTSRDPAAWRSRV